MIAWLRTGERAWQGCKRDSMRMDLRKPDLIRDLVPLRRFLCTEVPIRTQTASWSQTPLCKRHKRLQCLQNTVSTVVRRALITPEHSKQTTQLLPVTKLCPCGQTTLGNRTHRWQCSQSKYMNLFSRSSLDCRTSVHWSTLPRVYMRPMPIIARFY